jgi:hypothetical protein
LDLASGLVEVQSEYWRFLDRPTLVRLSMEHVSRVLGIDHAAFFLASKGGAFRLAGQVDSSAGGMTSIRVSEEQRKELEKKRVIAAESSDALAAHVPVYIDRGETNEVLGLLSIGARENGKGYSGDDLKALAALGGKIGLALNAIQLGSPRPWASEPSIRSRRRRMVSVWRGHDHGDSRLSSLDGRSAPVHPVSMRRGSTSNGRRRMSGGSGGERAGTARAVY